LTYARARETNGRVQQAPGFWLQNSSNWLAGLFGGGGVSFDGESCGPDEPPESVLPPEPVPPLPVSELPPPPLVSVLVSVEPPLWSVDVSSVLVPAEVLVVRGTVPAVGTVVGLLFGTVSGGLSSVLASSGDEEPPPPQAATNRASMTPMATTRIRSSGRVRIGLRRVGDAY
jgi:hypothetical protein